MVYFVLRSVISGGRMRDDLERFFKDFGYEEEDGRQLPGSHDAIIANKETARFRFIRGVKRPADCGTSVIRKQRMTTFTDSAREENVIDFNTDYSSFDLSVIIEVILIAVLIALIGAAGHTFFAFSMKDDYDEAERKRHINPWDVVNGRSGTEKSPKPPVRRARLSASSYCARRFSCWSYSSRH